LFVKIGKYGRILLPKEIRDKYGIKKGSRLIIRDYKGRIILVPVTTYNKPTEALHGSIKLKFPIEEPKEEARTHVRNSLVEELK
jgi:AbrB family looped-hinge helix DNA binding protein